MIPDLLLALMGVPGDVFELDPTSNDAVVERSRARVRALERELALANEERERERA